MNDYIRTSIIIMLAYGGHCPSHTLGPKDTSRGIMVVSCPEKSANRLGGGRRSLALITGRMFSNISDQRGPMASLA